MDRIMATRTYSVHEIETLADAIYRERVHPDLDSVENGTFVVIDVESADFEIGDEDTVATRLLLERRPTAVTYAIRVGHRAAYSHLGGFLSPDQDD